MLTVDLVEAGRFSIFPWFPPYDVDVSGLRWIEVMRRLIATDPQVVVPGRGDVSGPRLLVDVRACSVKNANTCAGAVIWHLEAVLRHQVGIDPNRVPAVLDLAAVGIVNGAWRNGPFKDVLRETGELASPVGQRAVAG